MFERLEPRLLLSADALGLVAAYAFNETSGTTAADATSHAIVGTLTNGPTFGAGKYDNAIVLDGVNDYVNLGNPTALQLTGSMTLSAWVNASAFPVDDAAVVSKRIGGELGFQLDVTKDTGPRTIGFKLTNSAGGQMFRYGATTLQPGNWYHIAGVYDAATQSLHVYLNGQLDDGVLQGAVTASQQNPTGNVTVGRRSGNTGFEFAGRVDDVRIYERALTAAEIQTDMLTSVGTSGSGDSTPPEHVHLHEPLEGAVVGGIVVVEAHAADNVGVAGVQFFVDGVLTGSLDTEDPYALTWDTRTLSNGAHTLMARAYDTSGNSADSSPVTVNVSNTNHFRNEILATGFDLPTAIEFLPDGRLLVVELEGTIEVVPAPYTQADPTPFLQLANIGSAGVQQGIYDIALDPDFETNHHYYVFYTLGTPNVDRLSRFTANESLTGTIAGSEFVLYQDPQSADAEHHGGAITFGNDGKIYFTTGEHFIAGSSQLLTNPRGKIHRINPDGTVPTDNPFFDGAGPNWDSIWALGLRNPYRAYYDAATGRLFFGDVGGNDYSTAKEEVNIGVRGANYGWPNVEGTSTNPAYTNPLYSYPHNGRDASVTGGFVYHGNQFPSIYQGAYFFADYTQNWIRVLTFDANGDVTGVLNFEPADGSVDGPYGDIVYLTEGPEGALYYVDLGYSDIGGTFGVSKIRRISYVNSDLPPVVAASASPTEGASPLTVSFSSAGSSDPEGLPLTYLWSFGDEETSTASDPQHTYANAGVYQARLTVSDGVNDTLSVPISITAGNRPVATVVTTPSDGGLFKAGDVISFSGDATDTEDGELSASAFTWNIDFLHEGHVHPGIPITGVKSGSFTIPTSGHDYSGSTRYRITLTVADSDGLQDTQTSIVFPDKVDLRFDTVPGGLTLYVDGIAHTGPFFYDTLIGFNHTIEARDQAAGTTAYTFVGWSDGGAQQHTITVPAAPQSYTANYTVVTNPIPAGLSAAYAFDETSGTTTAADASGHAIVGTLTNGPTFGAGKYDNAIVLDGVNDYVNLGNPTALQLTGSMTLSAWVNASAFPVDDAAVVSKRIGGELGFQLDVTKDTGPRTIGFKLTNSAGGQMFRYGATTLQPGNWYHIAGVYDAATQSLHVYLNGQLDDGALQGTVTASQQNSTGNVTIGRRSGTGFEFAGRIDDVRIYEHALTAAEIQRDMAISLGAPDTTEPSAPTALSATPISPTQINLSWAASTDNVAVTGYRVFRDGTEIGTTSTASFSDTGLAASTSYGYAVRATDAAGNLSDPATVNATTAAPDTVAPSVALTGPAAGATVSGTVTLTADAGDDVGVTGVQFLVDGANLGAQDDAAPYGVSWNTTAVPNGSHTLLAVARDAAGNVTTSSAVTVTVNNAQTAGLSAAYAFDETSGTTTAADASGHAIVGTLTNGPTFGAGKYDNAIVLDGVNDYVNLGNPTALQLTGSMTLSAWVNASAFPVDDAAVVSKRIGGELGFQLDVTKDTGPRTIGFKLTNSAGGQMFRYGATTLQPGNWYHIAGVYDAATQSLHVYLNGQLDDGALQGTVTASQQNSTGNVTIGRRSGTGFEFAGRIDDVRIYEHALTAAEIQRDMAISLGAPDTTEPSAPTALSATPISPTQINLSWAASTDNVAVTGYRVFRDGTEIGTTSTASFSDTGLAASTSYGYAVRATDAAGNLSDPATVNATTAAPDTVAPSVALTGPAAGATVSGTVTLTADAGDDVGVTGVQFLVDGANLGAQDDAAPYGVSWNTTAVPNGSHTLLAVARDAAGNVTTSSAVTVTVNNAQTAGLSAAYAFDETSGTTTAADASGHAIVGTLTNGPTFGAGKYDNAIVLDGVNDYVNLGNPTALQLTGSMTLSAWVNASAFPVDDAAVVSKRIGGELGFQLDVTKDTGPRTIGFKLTNSAGGQMFRYGATTLQPGNWYHIAGVYDAATQSLHVYLNGQLDDGALQGTVTASQQNSTGNVTIGRRSGTGFEFAGRIDDVRIYEHALTAAEIQRDMAISLGAPDTTEPSAPTALSATPISPTQINLSWAASTDNVAVTGYRVFRDGTEIGTTSTASFSDTGLAASTSYGYAVRATDAAGNLSDPAVTVANTQTAGLVAEWSFNEASGTLATDNSGNNNTATLVNGVARGTGNHGGGLTFDGVNDYLTVPNSASLNISGTGLTLSMWINPQALAGGDSVVLGKFWNATMTSPFYQYGLELAGGTVPVLYIGTTSGPLSASMGSALALNQWSNLAVVFNGSQAQFYVNGALAATVPLSASITARGNALRLGADANTQQFFKGSLDDVRIYARALTAGEIQNNMVTPL